MLGLQGLAVVCYCALGSAFADSHVSESRGSPIEKVIVMLSQNKAKVQADLDAEEKEMAEYTEYCDNESDEKKYAIKTATRKIADLDATILDCKAQLKGVEDEIASIGTELAAKETQMNDAKAVRKEDRSEFEATEKELVEAVDQLDKAIVLLKKGLSLAQLHHHHQHIDLSTVVNGLSRIVDAAWLDQDSKATLRNLLQQQNELRATTGDAAGLAESDDLRLTVKKDGKSGTEAILQSIIDMKEKAQETLSNTRTAEMKNAHNFQMMEQSLTGGMNLLNEKLSENQQLKASLSEESGKAKGGVSEMTKGMREDKVYLSSLTHACESAASEWEARKKSGSDEIAAIEKAKEILSDRVKAMLQSGFEVDHGKSVVKQPWVSGASQDEAFAGADDDKQARVRTLLVKQLKEMGHKFHSYTMMEMVSAAATDPFEKIRGLITDMVAKLIAENNAEASQKAFCDEEKAKSNKEKDKKTMRLDKLSAKLDHATAKTEELEDSIKELQAELADIDKATAEATKIRNQEHATYEKASKDFKDGAAAVEDAIGVLKAFYASFVQEPKAPKALVQEGKAAPDFGGPKTDASAGIIALLEVSAEEFTKMYTEVQSDEMEGKATYDRLMQESKTSTASKKAEIKGSESTLKQLAVSIRSYKEDHEMSSKELDAVMSYLDKLKPQCETKVLTFEEKKARREAEIEGLKEALNILTTPQSLVQRRSLRASSGALEA